MAILGDKLRDYQRQFNTTHLLALCDYFHNTFIRHYRLFQYVLGQDQEVNLTVTHLEVCVPLPPLPLAAGVDREVWKHEQQVAELQVAEVQKRTHMLLLKEAMTLERGHLLQKAFEDMPVQPGQLLRREVSAPGWSDFQKGPCVLFTIGRRKEEHPQEELSASPRLPVHPCLVASLHGRKCMFPF